MIRQYSASFFLTACLALLFSSVSMAGNLTLITDGHQLQTEIVDMQTTTESETKKKKIEEEEEEEPDC